MVAAQAVEIHGDEWGLNWYWHPFQPEPTHKIY